LIEKGNIKEVMKNFLEKNGLSLFLILILGLGIFYYSQLKPKEIPSPKKEADPLAQKITMFAKSTCIYCLRAKNYLHQKGLHFKEIELTDNKEAYEELSKLMERVTVPQIFIGEHHVGGYSDLIKLTDEELNALLYPEGK